MKEKIIIASKNEGKLKEFKRMLECFDLDVVSMGEANISDDIEESGNTFEENSMIKAKTIFEKTGSFVIADDSGLEIDYLNGAPGVFSARFAGEGASDQQKRDKVLRLLDGVNEEKRAARFVCCITVILGQGKSFQAIGKCEGRISNNSIGDKGFGYDPIFYIPEFKKTMAQLEPDVKNKISHRGKALEDMMKKLKSELGLF